MPCKGIPRAGAPCRTVSQLLATTRPPSIESARRPALIVQADHLDTTLPQTVVAMITSNTARAGHPSRVMVPAGSGFAKGSGLLMDSVIMTDNLATIHYSEIDRAIGAFGGMEEVDRALRTTLSL